MLPGRDWTLSGKGGGMDKANTEHALIALVQHILESVPWYFGGIHLAATCLAFFKVILYLRHLDLRCLIRNK